MSASRRVGVGGAKRHNSAPAARPAITPLPEARYAFEHPFRPLACLDGEDMLTGDNGRCPCSEWSHSGQGFERPLGIPNIAPPHFAADPPETARIRGPFGSLRSRCRLSFGIGPDEEQPSFRQKPPYLLAPCHQHLPCRNRYALQTGSGGAFDGTRSYCWQIDPQLLPAFGRLDDDTAAASLPRGAHFLDARKHPVRSLGAFNGYGATVGHHYSLSHIEWGERLDEGEAERNITAAPISGLRATKHALFCQ